MHILSDVRALRAKGILGVCFLLIVLVTILTPVDVMANGLDSHGNADGVLTWELGSIDPGESKRETVLFAFADSREDLISLLERARSDPLELPDTHPPTSEADSTDDQWIKNASTDFSLDETGAFLWEGQRQALTCARGGQLSRFGYFLHYDCGFKKQAGVSIQKSGLFENLRVVEPVRVVSSTQLSGRLQTEDGRIEIQIRAILGNGPVAAIEFAVQNLSDAPLADVRLTTYSNLEAAHDHPNDYGILDPEVAGLLLVDAPTGMCVTMAGMHPPVTGYAGVWASENQLRKGTGVGFEEWTPFAGITPEIREALARVPMPHPPAPTIEPDEPETRTLTEAEATEALKRDWLFQAEGKPLGARTKEEIAWAKDLAERIGHHPSAPDLSAEVAELDALLRRIEEPEVESAGPAVEGDLYLQARRIKRRMAFKNPAIDFSEILFIDNPYTQGAEWPHEARHRNGMMAVPGGRLLVLKGLSPGGEVRKIAPEKPGSFWRPDLSFDASKVVFCCKPHDEKSFHLYEINLDGTGLRQLTFGDYDDLDPIYLPDGNIMFSTSRCNTYIRCMPYTYAYVLARCDSDGENIFLLSRGNEPDWLPTLLNDGRVIYTRWEYTDKALWRIQSLWTVNQDGTNTAVFWGNQSVWPDMLVEPRPIPNSNRVMFTGAAHHDWFAGSVGILDPAKGRNFPNGLTKVTADVAWPECGLPPLDPIESPKYRTSGAYDAYKTPYPLSDEDFLVSARSNGKYRLYLMDVHGNRELIYEGVHHIWHAIPVRPRKQPLTHPDRVAWPQNEKERMDPEPGVFYSTNVYQGVPDLPRGVAKYLRVIQMDSKTYSTWTRDARFSGPAVSLIQDDGVKRILGTVPIESDGSVHFRVPSGKALHFQLLDEDYRALQTMRSFTGVMPGERRGCVGCHEMHSVTPLNNPSLAPSRSPNELSPPPWGTATISYEKLVQPVLDEHCGTCHQDGGEGQEALDLTLRPGFLFFKEPYVTLVGKTQWGNSSPEEMTSPESPGVAGAMLCENFDPSDPNSYATLPPMQYFSYKSKLVENAMSGEHHDVKVDQADLRKLIGWVDANCPYRGEEEIRAIPDPDFPGIEKLPIRPLCENAPVVARP